MFDVVSLYLRDRFGDRATISVEVFNDSEPLGKLGFDKEATPLVASLLGQLLG
jgi:hypothetical protein